MAPLQDQYDLLPSQDDSSITPVDLVSFTSKTWKRVQSSILPGLLVISLALNVFAIYSVSNPAGCVVEKPTEFAGLTRNVMKPFDPEKHHGRDNGSLADTYWENLNVDAGVISLPDNWAAEMGLLRAQPFPWDNTRSIYLLNGYHNVHCLKTIRKSLVEYRNGKQQSWPSSHVDHCLEHLLDDAFCTADDTPTKEHGTPGVQYRQCRSWSALEAWAKQHTACYKFVNETDNLVKLDRFAFCPEGSPYMAEVRKWYPDAVPYY